VRNASERSFHATLSASVESKPPTPKKLPSLDTREVDLAAGETREVTWEVTAPINATTLEWRVDAVEGASSADGEAARDALKVSQRVIPATPERTFQATIFQLTEPQSVVVQRPLDAIPGRGGVNVRVQGNAGVGVAENMMSGSVIVEGSSSQSAAASARGGLLVIHGDASARCGISLKGADIVVRGSVGHMSAFMAQKGCLVVCGDAGEALGDSLYEARLYVRGSVVGLGADCIEKDMNDLHVAQVRELLAAAGIDDVDASDFRRYGSARQLYNFHIDNVGSY